MALSTRTRHARALFGGIAPQYGWMGGVWSFGQDTRWRRFLVDRLSVSAGQRVLDVATGTGLVARQIVRTYPGARVVAVDPSEAMVLSGGVSAGALTALGRAEELPFADGTFAALSVTYLLRYVDDPGEVVRELARVVRPGGVIASLEFFVPQAAWARRCWRIYTRDVMPAVGGIVSPAWAETGRFLGPSIERFWSAHPLGEQLSWWRRAGVADVRSRAMSNGAAIVIWGRRT